MFFLVRSPSSVENGKRSMARDGHDAHHQSQRAARSIQRHQRVTRQTERTAADPDDAQTHRQGPTYTQ